MMFVKALVKIFVWGLLRIAGKQTDAALSDSRARDFRVAIEDRLLKLATQPQKGWRKETKMDDRALRFAQIVMKSRWLDKEINSFRGVKPPEPQ